MRLQSKKSRVLAVLTAFASVATVGLVSTANADLGTGSTLSPNTGVNTPTTAMTLAVTAPSNVCQGDSATGGYRWNMYVAAASVDPGTLTLSAGAISAPGGAYASALYTPTGTPQVNRNTAAATGQIVGTLAVNLETSAIPGNGLYNVGFICTLAGATTRHWISGTFTVANWTSSTSFNWGQPAIPTTPVGSTAVGNGATSTISGNIASVAAITGVTGYTVTATQTGGSADPSSPRVLNVPAAGLYSLPANLGSTYSVAITATNALGTSPATTIAGVAVVPGAIGAPVVTSTAGIGQFTVNWTTPAAPGATLLNYTVTVTPSVAGSPFTVPAGTNTLVVTAPAGNYGVSVLPNYAAPFAGTAGTLAGAASNPDSVIVQDIQVVRPVGALVLTQKCGVFGSAELYSDYFFGTLPALAATPGADPDGAAPAAVGTAPTLGAGGTADGNFAEYPYPVDANGVPNPTYPTNCAIDLGIGQLITSGPSAGTYFKATGRIAQLTVVNTRDDDGGWTLNGRMSDFVSTTDATDTFSGNLLGWDPEVTWNSPANLDGYDMVVTAGGVRQPQASASTTGLGAGFNSTNAALASSLAQSTPFAATPTGGTGSLGMAVMDARLRLLIPVTADAGTYRGTLTFTTV